MVIIDQWWCDWIIVGSNLKHVFKYDCLKWKAAEDSHISNCIPDFSLCEHQRKRILKIVSTSWLLAGIERGENCGTTVAWADGWSYSKYPPSPAATSRPLLWPNCSSPNKKVTIRSSLHTNPWSFQLSGNHPEQKGLGRPRNWGKEKIWQTKPFQNLLLVGCNV